MEEPQKSLFDLSGKEFNPFWVDESSPVFVPNNPLHWKAHKLQILIKRLEIQQQKNPAQFNSTTYTNALNEFATISEKINSESDKDEILDEGDVGEIGNTGSTDEVGARATSSVDTRVSADNPLAG